MRKIALVVALSLAGCIKPPPPPEFDLANAYYGPPPPNAHALAEDAIKQSLFDPYSADFRHWPVMFKSGLRFGRTIQYGWLQCGRS